MTAPLPEVFQEIFSELEELRMVIPSDNRTHECFGCGPGHPSGLRIRSFKTDEGVASPIIVSPQHQGPPGAAHGGIVAAYLDEVLAATVMQATSRVAVTGELTVRYIKPVPTDTPIVGRGVLVADHGRYVDVEGRLENLRTGSILATARARFFPIPI